MLKHSLLGHAENTKTLPSGTYIKHSKVGKKHTDQGKMHFWNICVEKYLKSALKLTKMGLLHIWSQIDRLFTGIVLHPLSQKSH